MESPTNVIENNPNVQALPELNVPPDKVIAKKNILVPALVVFIVFVVALLLYGYDHYPVQPGPSTTPTVTFLPATDIPTETPPSPTITATPSLGANQQAFTFEGGPTVVYTGSETPKTNDAGDYLMTVADTLYRFRFFKTVQEFTNTYPVKSYDSNGTEAGGGSILLPQKEVINKVSYQKYLNYYNPIGITASGKYDAKISSFLSGSCVAFVGNGVFVIVSTYGDCTIVKTLKLYIQ